jgi:hypothetical protein
MARGWTAGIRNPARARLYYTASRRAFRTTQSPIQWLLEAISPRVRRSECVADHSPVYSADVKDNFNFVFTVCSSYIIRIRQFCMYYVYSIFICIKMFGGLSLIKLYEMISHCSPINMMASSPVVYKIMRNVQIHDPASVLVSIKLYKCTQTNVKIQINTFTSAVCLNMCDYSIRPCKFNIHTIDVSFSATYEHIKLKICS